MGRAPAIVVTYLMLFKDMLLDEAYDYVHGHRYKATPNKRAIQEAVDDYLLTTE